LAGAGYPPRRDRNAVVSRSRLIVTAVVALLLTSNVGLIHSQRERSED